MSKKKDEKPEQKAAELPACVQDSISNARALIAAGAYDEKEAAQFLCDSDPAFFPTLESAVDILAATG